MGRGQSWLARQCWEQPVLRHLAVVLVRAAPAHQRCTTEGELALGAEGPGGRICGTGPAEWGRGSMMFQGAAGEGQCKTTMERVTGWGQRGEGHGSHFF